MRTIALANQKGGSGKTTTGVNLSAALASCGKNVLLIDIDPQSHSTIHLGVKSRELELSISHVLLDNIDINETIRETSMPGFNLIPSSIHLVNAEVTLSKTIGSEVILKAAVAKLHKPYDYIFIDCPPSMGILTLNALTTVKEVFIPVETEFLALEGLTKLLETVKVVKERLNSSLKITGVIACKYDMRTNLSREVVEKIEEHFKDKVFKTKIRQNIALAEAPSYGKTILSYAPHSHGAEDYMALAKEVINSG